MEREIKVGSKWRVSAVDVTVKAVDDTVLASFDGHEDKKIEVSRDAWLQIARHVSDPVEAPKVGDWVRCKPHGGIGEIQTRDNRAYPYVVRAWGTCSPVLCAEELQKDYEPCSPPPLHAALRELVRLWNNGPCDVDSFSVATQVARLYANGER